MKVILTALFIVLNLVSCGIPDVSTPKAPLQGQKLQTYVRNDINLTNSKLFLWKDTSTSEDVSRALGLSRKIETLDAESLPYNLKEDEIQKKIEPLRDRSRWISSQLKSIRTLYNYTSGKQVKTQQTINALNVKLEEEKAKPIPDPLLLERLSTQIADLQSQLLILNTQLTQLSNNKSKLEADLLQVNEALVPLHSTLTGIKEKQSALQEEGRRALEEIMQLVEWYDNQPTSIQIQFPSGVRGEKIEISITGWNPGKDPVPPEFSTSNPSGAEPSIKNAAYIETGGILTFDVILYQSGTREEVREIYSFHVSRSNKEANVGKVTFSGDLIRKRMVQGKMELKRGYAKFSDRNN